MVRVKYQKVNDATYVRSSLRRTFSGNVRAASGLLCSGMKRVAGFAEPSAGDADFSSSSFGLAASRSLSPSPILSMPPILGFFFRTTISLGVSWSFASDLLGSLFWDASVARKSVVNNILFAIFRWVRRFEELLVTQSYSTKNIFIFYVQTENCKSLGRFFHFFHLSKMSC